MLRQPFSMISLCDRLKLSQLKLAQLKLAQLKLSQTYAAAIARKWETAA